MAPNESGCRACRPALTPRATAARGVGPSEAMQIERAYTRGWRAAFRGSDVDFGSMTGGEIKAAALGARDARRRMDRRRNVLEGV